MNISKTRVLIIAVLLFTFFSCICAGAQDTAASIEIDGFVVWSGDTGLETVTRPGAVTLAVVNTSTNPETPVTLGTDCTAGPCITWANKDTAEWTYAIKNLPHHAVDDANQTEIIYRVSETVPDQYAVSPDGGILSSDAALTKATSENVLTIGGMTFTDTLDNTTTVRGTKVWLDGVTDHSQYPDPTLTLYADVTLSGTYTLVWDKTSETWKWTFTGLPRYTNGKTISYYIQETAPDGYIAAYSSTDRALDGGKITNIKTTSISVTKAWDDFNNANRPDITLNLWFSTDGGTTKNQLLDTNKATLGISADIPSFTAVNEVYTANNLPAYDLDGNAVIWYVKETMPEGYQAGYADNELGMALNGETITNYLTTRSIGGTKVWLDGVSGHGDTAEPAFTLYADNAVYTGAYMVTWVKTTDPWTWTIANLPRYSSGTTEYEYSVIETASAEYSIGYSNGIGSTVTERALNGGKITNTKLTSISVTKAWDDFDNQNRPAVTLHLWYSIGGAEAVQLTAENMGVLGMSAVPSFTAAGSIYSVRGLPTADPNNNVIIWYAKEDIPDGYTVFYQTGDKAVNGETITNALSTTTYDVTKIWRDGVATSSERDVSEYKLYADDKEATGYTLTWTKTDNVWTASIKGLQRYIEGTSTEIKWNLRESNVPETYQAIYSSTDRALDNGTITDTKYTTYSVTKSWDDQNNTGRPTSSTFELWVATDGATPEKLTTGNLAKIGLSAVPAFVCPVKNAGGDVCAVSNLPVGDINNKPLTWYCLEPSVPTGYVAIYENDGNIASNGSSIINAITKRTLSGTKQWYEDEGTTRSKPVLTLYANGEKLDSTTAAATLAKYGLTASTIPDPTWSSNYTEYKFSGLLSKSTEGAQIIWSAEEIPNSGYVCAYSGTGEPVSRAYDGDMITNIQTTNLSFEKSWYGSEVTPSFTTYYSTDNGVNWTADTSYSPTKVVDTYNYIGLPKYMKDADGNYKAVIWSVEENELTNYSPIYTNTDTTVTDRVLNGGYVQNKNTEVVNISGTKVWSDGENAYGTRPSSVTLTASSSTCISENNCKSVTVTSDNDWAWTLADLPKYNQDGTLQSYTIQEGGAPDYVLSVVTNPDGTRALTNTLSTQTLKASKMWNDVWNVDSSRPDGSLDFELKKCPSDLDCMDDANWSSFTPAYTFTLSVADVEASDSNTWEHVITGVPTYKPGTSTTLNYRLEEKTELPAGYTKSVSGVIVTNTRPQDTTSFTAKKIWSGQTGTSATLQLNKTINGMTSEVDTTNNPFTLDGTVDAVESTAWQMTWTGLPVKEIVNGIIYTVTYSVAETKVNGNGPNPITGAYGNYVSSDTYYDADLAANIVTNTYKTVSFKGTVTWMGDELTQRPSAITLKLYTVDASGNLTLITTQPAIDWTYDNDNNLWTYSISGLPKYSEDGSVLTYAIAEDGYIEDTNGHYYRTVNTPSQGVKDTDGNVTAADIINYATVVAYHATKVWADQDITYPTRPDYITVKLQRSVDNGTTWTDVAGKTGTLSKSESWPDFNFENLPALIENSGTYTVIQYRIKEAYIGSQAVTDNGDTGIATDYYNVTYSYSGHTTTITNTLITSTVKGTKIWNHKDNPGERPTSADFELIGNGTIYGTTTMDCTNDDDQTCVHNSSTQDIWTYTWTNMPIRNSGGVINYQLLETSTATNYYSVPDPSNPLGVIDTYGTQNTSYSVYKTWINHGSESFPTVEIKLQRCINNGTVDCSANSSNWEEMTGYNKTLSNGYTYTGWGDDNSPLGSEYNYRAREIKINSLDVTSVSGVSDAMAYSYFVTHTDASNGKSTAITNELQVTNISGTKIWTDGQNAYDTRPSTYTINVFTNADGTGTAYSSKTMATDIKTGETHTTQSWVSYNLRKYDDDNNLMTYYVFESAIDGYDTTYSSHLGTDSPVVTNTLQTKSIDVTKIWADDNNRDGIRPGNAVMILQHDGIPYSDKSLTISCPDTASDTCWKGTWSGVPVYQSGTSHEIVYSVSENSADGYTAVAVKTGDSFTVTNTHVPETVTFTVRRSWVGDETSARPDGKFKLYADGTPLTDTAYDITLTSTDTEYTWTNLPRYTNDGGVSDNEKPIEYTAEEYNLGGQNVATNAYNAKQAGNYYITSDQWTNGYGVDITNTWQTITFTGSKIWSGGDVGTPQLVFYRKSDNEAEAALTTQPSLLWTLTEDATKRNYSLAEPLQRFDSQGSPYVYSIKETAITNWLTLPAQAFGTIADTATGDVTDANITNTYNLTSLPVNIVWVDESNAYDTRPKDPTTVTIQLQQSSDGGTTWTTVANSLYYSNSSFTIPNLTKYYIDSNNQLVQYYYRGVETQIGSLDIAKNSEDVDSAGAYTVKHDYPADYAYSTVTNSLIYKDKTVQKVWADNGNQDGKRPAYVILKIMRNGVDFTPVRYVRLNEGTTTYTFQKLPAKNYDGNDSTYTVQEMTSTDGYTYSSTTAEDGTIIATNTHTPETTSWIAYKVFSGTTASYPAEDVELYLEQSVNNGATWSTVAGTAQWLDSSAGTLTYTWNNLPVYAAGVRIKYRAREMAVGEKDDTAKQYVVMTIGTQSVGDSFAVTYNDQYQGRTTITNTLQTKSFSGIKKWIDTSDKFNTRPTSVSVDIYIYTGANGLETKVMTYSPTKPTPTADEWSWSVSGLRKYYGDGTEILYAAVETSAPHGYTIVYPDNQTYALNGEKITNDLITTPEEGTQTSITIKKQWADNSDEGGIRPDQITYEILHDGVSFSPKVTGTLANTGNEDQVVWDNLPYYRTNSDEAIVYSVKETSVPKGYTYTLASDGLTMIDTLNRISLSGTVYWHGDTAAMRPSDVTINLYQDNSATLYTYLGNNLESQIAWSKNDAAGTWSYEISGLPAYKADGTLHTWQALQVKVDSPNPYILSPNKKVSGTVAGNGNITGMDFHDYYNIRLYEMEKNWTIGVTPVAVDFCLQRRPSNASETTAWTQVGDPFTLSASPWTKSWSDLDVYDFSNASNPVTYVYRVMEMSNGIVIPNGNGTGEYKVFYTWGEDSSVTDANNITHLTGKTTVKNDLNDTFTFTKNWDDEFTTATAASRPALTFSLWFTTNNTTWTQLTTANLSQFGLTEMPSLSGPDATSGKASGTYAFSLLPKNDINQNVVTWSVVETMPDAASYIITYTNPDKPTVTDRALTGGTIKNTHQTIPFSGFKVWLDDNNRYKIRPAAIELKVYKLENNAPVEPAAYTFTVTPDSTTGEWKIDGLNRFDNDGNEITYVVKETEINGYSTTYTGEAAYILSGQTITNTLIRTVTAVEVKKVWDDNNNEGEIRPTEIGYEVLHDSSSFDPIVSGTLNSANTWTVSYTNLPRYNKDGTEIVYTATENPIPSGYTTEVNGMILTNSLKRISLSGTVYWHNDTAALRPSDVTINLYQDGLETPYSYLASSITWNKDDAAGTWSYVISGLPAYKGDGTLHTWEALQTVVPSYVLHPDAKVSGTVDTNGDITLLDFHDYYNIHPYSMEKVWTGGVTVPTTAVTFVLQRKLSTDPDTAWAQEGNVISLSDPNWTYSWTNLPYYEFPITGEPVAYDYRVSEIKGEFVVPNGGSVIPYKVTYDWGNVKTTVTNQPMDVFQFTKTWNDEHNDVPADRPQPTFGLWYKTAASNWIRLTSAAEDLERFGLTAMPSIIGIDTNNNTDTTGKIGGTYRFSDLPVNDISMEAVTWSVIETIDSTYSESYSNPEDVTVTDRVLNGGAITNTEQVKSFSGYKAWSDSNNRYESRPSSITIEIYTWTQAGGRGDLVNTYNSIEPDAVSGKWTIKNLPRYKEDGSEYIYAAKEIAPNGYTCTYPEGKDYIVQGETLTNELVKTSVTVSKTWIDKDNSHNLRPATINYEFLHDGQSFTTPVTGILDAADNWASDVWTDLPLNRAGTTDEIVYTVKETSELNNYYSYIDNTGFNMVNKLDLIDLSGTVYWHNDTTALRPSGVTINLYLDGSLTPYDYPSESIIWTIDNDAGTWSYVIKDLPAYKEDGTLHTWEALQTVVPSYVLHPDGKVTGTVDSTTGDVTLLDFHNYYNVRSYAMEKVWDNVNAPAIAVTFILQRKLPTEGDNAWAQVGDSISLSDPTWTYIWNNAEVYYFPAQGDPIAYDYRVSETSGGIAVPDGYSVIPYKVTYDWNMTDPAKTIVTNRALDIFQFTKNWDDEHSDEPEARPMPAFTLWYKYADSEWRQLTTDNLVLFGFTAMPSIIGTDTNNNTDITGKIGGTYRFSDLPVNDIYQKAVTWSVTESIEDVYHYVHQYHNPEELTITDRLLNGGVLLNTQQVKSFSGIKVWSDSDNKYNSRPASITIEIYTWTEAGGLGNLVQTFTEVIPDAATGKWTVINLPRYQQDGSEYIYAAKEVLPNGYTCIYPDTDGYIVNGETLTNVLIKTTASVKVSKTWEDKDNAQSLRPSSISYELLHDGQSFTPPVIGTLDAADNWASDEWTDLPLYRSGSNSEAIVYTVKEDPVPDHYYYSLNPDGLTMVNKLNLVNLNGTIEWHGDTEEMRPTDVTIYVFQNDSDTPISYPPENITWTKNNETGVWTFHIINLPKYNPDGTMITYQASQEKINPYRLSPTVEVISTVDPVTGEVILSPIHNYYNTRTYELEKVWDRVAAPATALTFRLQRKLAGADDSTFMQLTDINLSSPTWTHSWSGLDEYDFTDSNNPVAYVYRVVEMDNGVIVPDKGTVASYKVTYDWGTDKTTVTNSPSDNFVFTKIWDDELSGNVSRRPVPEFVLWFSYDSTTWTQLTTDNLNLFGLTQLPVIISGPDSDGRTGGTYGLSALPSNDKQQVPVIWSMTENAQSLPDYTVTYNNPANSSLTDRIVIGGSITNHRGIRSVWGVKSWNDGDNRYATRPKTLTIEIYILNVDGTLGQLLKTVEVTPDSVSGEWFVDGFARYAEDGSEITYAVKEIPPSGYVVHYADNAEYALTGQTINNELIKVTNAVTVRKVWNDNYNEGQIRPEKIEYELYHDGQSFDPKVIGTLNDLNKWQ